MPRTSPPYDVLRQVLIESRIARGLTQQALAKKLGRQQSFIGKIENASRNIDVIEFIEVARALDMDPARLLAKVVKAAYPK
ncbi:MAG: helix-turn-helix transcriptional regulator [Gammaproteobacteria bacterium]|nr:XRE family transcriptional regulator [Gammaproteobacteria bacterium]